MTTNFSKFSDKTDRDFSKNNGFDPMFYNKKGELNHYSLACGYIMQYEKYGKRITLEMESGFVRVTGFDFKNNCRLFWTDFDHRIYDAKQYYYKMIRQIEKENKIVPIKTKKETKTR